MPPLTLYSIRTHIDRTGSDSYYITKFVDGEVESAYSTTRETCECPAGVRPTCRHRQMLPHMLNEGIINTHWFLNWDDGRRVVDFEGTDKRIIDQIALPQPHSTTVSAPDFDSGDGGSNPPAVASTLDTSLIEDKPEDSFAQYLFKQGITDRVGGYPKSNSFKRRF